MVFLQSIRSRAQRFVELHQDENFLHTRWGRIGAAGESTSEEFWSRRDAKLAFEQRLRRLRRGGYQPGHHNPLLVDAIYQNIDSAGPYLVYGDWLQLQHDPRGELVALQNLRRLRPQDEALITHERELLRDAAPYFVDTSWASQVHLEWRWGFISRALYQTAVDEAQGGLLRNFLSHPSCQFLTELVIMAKQNYWPGEQWCRLLAASCPASLRSLKSHGVLMPKGYRSQLHKVETVKFESEPSAVEEGAPRRIEPAPAAVPPHHIDQAHWPLPPRAVPVPKPWWMIFY